MKTIRIYFVIPLLFLFIVNVRSQDSEKSVKTSDYIYGQGYKVTKHRVFKDSDTDYLFDILPKVKYVTKTPENLSINSFTFNHIALSVKDINQSATFYEKVLQLQEIKNRTEMDGIRWFSLGEGRELHLVSILKEPVSINKAVHFALSTPNFDSFVKILEAKNITYSDWPGTPDKINMRADGIKQIFFQDPNGYWIEVNSVGQK